MRKINRRGAEARETLSRGEALPRLAACPRGIFLAKNAPTLWLYEPTLRREKASLLPLWLIFRTDFKVNKVLVYINQYVTKSIGGNCWSRLSYRHF